MKPIDSYISHSFETNQTDFEDTWGFPKPFWGTEYPKWWVFVMENPNLKWMITRGTPVDRKPWPLKGVHHWGVRKKRYRQDCQDGTLLRGNQQATWQCTATSCWENNRKQWTRGNCLNCLAMKVASTYDRLLDFATYGVVLHTPNLQRGVGNYVRGWPKQPRGMGKGAGFSSHWKRQDR